MPLPIVVIGSNGQLGRQFLHEYGASELVGFGSSEVDVANPETFNRVKEKAPKVIINCAAYTNVDGAEANKEVARAVNAQGPAHLAELAKELDALLVHISTDYIFDGTATAPYTEEDAPHPINYYGQTKLEGEELVRSSGAKYLIARTAVLYGMEGPNFILTMLKLGKERDVLRVVGDQIGSPTYTKDLTGMIMALIDQKQTGTFHCVNSGAVSRYELVRELFSITSINTRVEEASTSEFPTPAKRPAYSALSNAKLNGYFRPQSWQKALADYVSTLSI